MTEKDIKRIEEAESLGAIAWYRISVLEDESESEEAKDRLHTLFKQAYRKEEAAAGLL